MKAKLRAFGYARVSVDEEGGTNASIAAQGAAIRAYAEREGVEVVQLFEEPGVSGRAASRKAFDRMIALATAPERPVDIVIVYALSRFARRLLTQLQAEDKLLAANVRLVSVTEGFGQDANSRLMRNMVGVMNEKYAHDASVFTRRDRRGNARAGFWNGGPVPFGYESRTVLTVGKKDRRRLFANEDEAIVVRLIYALAAGTEGPRLGTRAVAAYLNERGYTLRGRRFHHSNVDGILTREHYTGAYLDRTADDEGVTPSAEDAIRVECPRIIDPSLAAGVASLRAKAAPRVTPPRITSSPVLLTGLARCGLPGCRCGLTIRTGKGGRYGYYTCHAKAAVGAASCASRPVRREELDGLVLDAVLERVLRPDRLRLMVAGLLERSDEADERRRAELDRVRRERVGAETRLRRLFELVENGLMQARDRVFAERVAEHRAAVARLEEREGVLAAHLARRGVRVNEGAVERVGTALRERLATGDAALRRAYLRLFVSDVAVTNETVSIAGTRAAIEAAVARGARNGAHAVPSFDREWCRAQDSNL